MIGIEPSTRASDQPANASIKAHLARVDSERAQADEQHEEDRQLARERGEREHVPAPAEQADRLAPEVHEALPAPADRAATDESAAPG